MADTTIVWFHLGLRVDDHPALAHALSEFERVRAVYVYSEEIFGEWEPGAAQRWWIHEHLLLLGSRLAELGIELTVTTDSLVDTVLGARPSAVLWNEALTPAARRAANTLTDALRDRSIGHSVFAGDLLHDPDAIRTNAGSPYRVFTPFYKSFLQAGVPMPPVDTPEKGRDPVEFDAAAVKDLGLVADHPWVDKLRGHWKPGERAAADMLDSFLEDHIRDYHERRDLPGIRGTSRLSPYLAVGAIGPRRVWQEVLTAARAADLAGEHFPKAGSHAGTDAKGYAGWLRELGWREFGYHLLIHYPHTTDQPLREDWAAFPWSMDEGAFERWKRGRTGYPIVDAGMRQLWDSGWMHNRVRMIVASFLTKDLMIPWQEGARWFWDTLIDADLASNTLGWQWAAGSGADAQPFFRIF
ncbi:MAG: deoxyribodipyrimidine photo-lyase, partial [Rhodothermales bacterium]|nr:deoxyribodipyrimidine photo-lyase [Rhodothermales bacterium]